MVALLPSFLPPHLAFVYLAKNTNLFEVMRCTAAVAVLISFEAVDMFQIFSMNAHARSSFVSKKMGSRFFFKRTLHFVVRGLKFKCFVPKLSSLKFG